MAKRHYRPHIKRMTNSELITILIFASFFLMGVIVVLYKIIKAHIIESLLIILIVIIILTILVRLLLPIYLKKKRELKNQIIEAIRKFKPSQTWSSEEGYHGELQGWLRHKFIDSKVEVQRGSSRPDIVIGNIAIEIKGPTTHDDLNTIASKCMRYKNHFKDGFIVVLFDVVVSHRMYEEWKDSLLDTFKDVIIIRK